MYNKVHKTILILALALFVTSSMALAVSPKGAFDPASGITPLNAASLHTAVDSIPKLDLNDTERDGIFYMAEEETLARDVYESSYEMHQLPIFQNIANAEQTHIDAVKVLVDRYGIEVSSTDERGVFVNVELQTLYDELVERSNESLEQSLRVGAFIEEIDIIDLQTNMNETDNNDIILVYENLEKGSRNHLRSFVSTMERYGFAYSPQALSQEEFDQIVNSPTERGPHQS